ncbi:MAG: zinc ribbon domain-containing protein [Deltaproteobacteria bacterium]
MKLIMPIYEYKCNDCGKEFEVLRKFSDQPLKACVHCSGKKVEKLISKSSFVLKGGGWGATNYTKKVEKVEKAEKAAPCEIKSTKPECSGFPSGNQ